MKELFLALAVVTATVVLLVLIPKRWTKWIWLVYLGGFLYYTLLSRSIHAERLVNLEFFHRVRTATNPETGLRELLGLLFSGEWEGQVDVHWKVLLREPLLNLLLFTPMGYLLPWSVKLFHDRFLRVAGASFAVSILVEILQLTLKLGWFDVEDMLFNLLGTILGYLLYSTFLRKRESWTELTEFDEIL